MPIETRQIRAIHHRESLVRLKRLSVRGSHIIYSELHFSHFMDALRVLPKIGFHRVRGFDESYDSVFELVENGAFDRRQSVHPDLHHAKIEFSVQRVSFFKFQLSQTEGNYKGHSFRIKRQFHDASPTQLHKTCARQSPEGDFN